MLKIHNPWVSKEDMEVNLSVKDNKNQLDVAVTEWNETLSKKWIGKKGHKNAG